MKCLIIAAGLGSRLATRGNSKPLVHLGGIPLIEHVIMTMFQAGITDFHVVIGYNAEKIRDHLTSFSRQQPVTIDFIHNDQWEKPNGISVYCAHQKIHEPFFLVMSDHLFEPSIIIDFQREGIKDGEVKLAVDIRTTDNPLVDLEDVTKVLTVDGNIIDIGKTIPHYNAFDTGIFLCSPALFQALAESSAAGDDSLSGGIRIMAGQKKARVFDIGNRSWIDIDDDAAFDRAQKLFRFNL